MAVEIGELVVRISVTETTGAAPAPADLDALLRRLRQELLERCREEIALRLQRDGER